MKPIDKIDTRYCPYLDKSSQYFCDVLRLKGARPWGEEPCTLEDWHRCPYNSRPVDLHLRDLCQIG